jgi:hypothetical protein
MSESKEKWEVKLGTTTEFAKVIIGDLVLDLRSLKLEGKDFKKENEIATLISCSREMLGLLQEIAKENVSKHYFEINKLIQKATTV